MRQVSAKTVVLGYVIRITFRSYSNLFVFMILYFEKTVGHAPRAVYVVVARHHRHAACQAYHCLVGAAVSLPSAPSPAPHRRRYSRGSVSSRLPRPSSAVLQLVMSTVIAIRSFFIVTPYYIYNGAKIATILLFRVSSCLKNV